MTDGIVAGSWPARFTVRLTRGFPETLAVPVEDGFSGTIEIGWGFRYPGGPAEIVDTPATIEDGYALWPLTAEEVDERAEFKNVQLVVDGYCRNAGNVHRNSGWSGNSPQQIVETVVIAGPPGPTAVSADAGNVATLGTDGRIYVPPSSASAEGIQDVVGAMIVAAGGTYDDEAGAITLPSSGGGDTTVQIGTVTLPESPTVGLSVSVLADSTTVLPEGVTWDSGGEPTITERMLLVFVWSGDDWVGTYGPSIPDAPIPPDETGPTAGTLGVVVGVTSADGTVTGAADETELHAAPYSFRIDAGTYSAWQAGATYEWTGLDPATEYDFQHRVRDAAGNVTEGAVVTDTTDADITGPTAGTLGVVPGVTTADLSVTGASDDIALHATPYAYSTDNGSTWSAYQAGATYEATGLTADTSYTFRHRVRDAAGNVTVGTAVTDSTEPDPTDVTPPTPGTLAASAITSDSFTLTVTGASDDEALHGTPYRFSIDSGVTYSAWQAGATFDATGLDPETEYTCIHQVRDAALNVATGSSIPVTTEAAAGGETLIATDDFNRADGALGTTPVGGYTWGGYVPFAVNTNRARMPSGSTGVSLIDAADTEHSSSVAILDNTKACGPVVRATSDGTAGGTSFYRFVYLSGQMYLMKHTAFGSATTLAQWAGTLTNNDRLTLRAATSSSDVELTCYRNGDLVQTFTDSSSPLAGTRVGLWGVSISIMDDFEARTY